MNRVNNIAFRLITAFFVLCVCFAVETLAQGTLEKAPPLPAGMTGSNVNDPRAKLSPGLFDAGEAAMGIKHLLLLKKPDAFQLGSDDPDSPKVQKTLGLLGIGDSSKMPKSDQLVLLNSLLPIPIWRFKAIICFREIFMVSAFMIFPIR